VWRRTSRVRSIGAADTGRSPRTLPQTAALGKVGRPVRMADEKAAVVHMTQG
jgi:hypothetical protein